jgi:YaaC-like Protein
MRRETWQQLLAFETRDLVSIWFSKIHGRDLNARRAKEITAAAKQAREFFRNSHTADNSVKPLLTFYGVASLARAVTLLLRRDGGEECLTRGHGLETVDWSSQLSGDLSVGPAALGGLRIRTCSGLFLDFAKQTGNRMSMHVRSSSVDWRLNYKEPNPGDEILFDQLTARLTDLQKEHAVLGVTPMYADIIDINQSPTMGLNIRVRKNQFKPFEQSYASAGYEINDQTEATIIAGTDDLPPPQFIHSYIHKMFGNIPLLFLAAPMPSGNRYSQLCFTYMLSYVLGMLARYFPTHWVSLAQGNKGDALWPMLNQAHTIAEETFPELVAELIGDILAYPSK